MEPAAMAFPSEERRKARPLPSEAPPLDQHRRPPSEPSNGQMNGDMCRICHGEAEAENPLISPCHCAGSLRYVHQACLQRWINTSDARCCELCKFSFVMQTKTKPFRKWRKLVMSSEEQREVLWSTTIFVMTITRLVWSLYMIVNGTAEQTRDRSLDWPIWIKLVVVAIGITGGFVLTYVQCRMYVVLLRRWRAFNSVVYVQDAPVPDRDAALPAAADLSPSGTVQGTAVRPRT